MANIYHKAEAAGVTFSQFEDVGVATYHAAHTLHNNEHPQQSHYNKLRSKWESGNRCSTTTERLSLKEDR